MRLLYWNLYGKNLIEPMAEIVESHEIDVLITSENKFAASSLISRLDSIGMGTFVEAWNFIDSIRIFTRLPIDRVKNLQDDGRITARRIHPIIGNPFTLIALHAPSKKSRTNSDQAAWIAHTLRPFIDQVEKDESHCRTVLIGDFNANPFEESIIAAMGIHSTSTRAVANKGARKVDGKPSKFFYNPMWSLFGDNSRGPPGTYYFSNGSHHEFFWHMFDQVMIRPDLIPYLLDGDVQILTNTGKRSLLNRRLVPHTSSSSDHLPIFVKFTF